MLTARQKIEAAFSREGSREFAATVCWEDVFVRDHWDQLTASPWYDCRAPGISLFIRQKGIIFHGHL